LERKRRPNWGGVIARKEKKLGGGGEKGRGIKQKGNEQNAPRQFEKREGGRKGRKIVIGLKMKEEKKKR